MIISTVTSTITFILLVFKRTAPNTSKKSKHSLVSVATPAAVAAEKSGTDQETARYENRVITGELLIGLVFIVLAFSCVLFTKIATGIGYFLFLLVAMFNSTVGTSLAQNGSFAIVSLFGPIYTQAIMVGQAIAGILPPIVSIISIISSTSSGSNKPGGEDNDISGKSTFFYFLIASIAALTAFVLFKIVLKTDPKSVSTGITDPETSAVLLHDGADSSYDSLLGEDASAPHSEDEDYDLEVFSLTQPQNVDPVKLISKLRVPIFTVFSVFSVTLAYPVFAQLVQPVHISPIIFNRDVFIPFSMFVWNLGDLVGRLVCGLPKWVVHGDRNFIIYSLARFAFLPAFLLLTNLNGRLTAGGGGLLGTWLGDEVYLVLHFFFGFTNGHLGSSAMMESPNYVEPQEREKGGSLMTLALSLGLTAGALFSLLLVTVLA